VAFKNLIARNKSSPISTVMSDAEKAAQDAKMKLPFIVVNTSKETAVDCWLSPDRCCMHCLHFTLLLSTELPTAQTAGIAFTCF